MIGNKLREPGQGCNVLAEDAANQYIRFRLITLMSSCVGVNADEGMEVRVRLEPVLRLGCDCIQLRTASIENMFSILPWWSDLKSQTFLILFTLSNCTPDSNHCCIGIWCNVLMLVTHFRVCV